MIDSEEHKQKDNEKCSFYLPAYREERRDAHPNE
tara:strand:+ start:1467 stop:1568 length:102 start_codon:yes stop_codon:yes gene_type:complete